MSAPGVSGTQGSSTTSSPEDTVGEANPVATSSPTLDNWLVTHSGNTQGLPKVSGLTINQKLL